MKDIRHLRALRTLAVLILAAAMLTSMPLVSFAASYDAESEVWSGDIGGIVEALGGHKSKTQAIIDYVAATYDRPKMIYKGKGECYGFAEMIRKMFGTGSKQKKLNIKPTKKNIWKHIKNCKPGTHVRFSQGKNGKGWCHSVAILKVSKSKVWIVEGNVGVKNGIRLSYMTPADFAEYARSYGYITWIKQPTGKAPTVKKLVIRAAFSPSGKGYVSWRPLKGAKKYVVYRSTSKNSGYKKIATVKNSRFVDKGAPMGVVYYKVKAKGKTSKPVAANRRLAAPKVYLKHSVVTDEDGGETSKITLTWKAVPGATKYIITDMEQNKTTVVTGTSYVMNGHSFFGSVKASAGNSKTDSYGARIFWYDNEW